MAAHSRPPANRRTPSERVVYAVAKRAEIGPLELPPLYNDIDPDALNSTIEAMESGTMEFSYAGHSVTVRSDGTVDVTGDSRSGVDRRGRATDD